MRRRTVLRVAAAAGTAALFAGCQYFSNVVIPAVDTTPPSAIAGVYDVEQGKYVALGFGIQSVYYDVYDPTTTLMAVGSTYDQGGAKSVSMTAEWVYYCEDSSGDVGILTDDFVRPPPPTSASQNGKVGDTVSNGVWAYFAVRFDQVPSARDECPRGWTPLYTAFNWSFESVDFHGNTSWGSGEIDYHGN
jgi:hypothetical protein